MRKFLRIFGIGVVCCALLAVAMIAWPSRYPPTPDPRTSRIIENVRIVDVVAGTVGQPQSLLIREGRIAAIGQFDASPALPRHDEGGAYAVPAFWDMHVHSFQSSPQMHFPLWVANGVLNVRLEKVADAINLVKEVIQPWAAAYIDGAEVIKTPASVKPTEPADQKATQETMGK